MNGVLVVDKPPGLTSHDVVAAARRALGTSRIGHTGTLDPAATGVLPLVVGHATRLARFLTAGDKVYEATVRFGLTTDTFDATGRVTGESEVRPSGEALTAALERFRGTFEQSPPPVSAKKVNGVRAYALARQDAPVPVAPVAVRVEALDLVDFDGERARLTLRCSAGFYVRSLAHDLGQALGTGAVLEALCRTRAGAFELAGAVRFDELVRAPAEALAKRLIPMEALLPELPAVGLGPDGVRRARQGQPLRPADADSRLPQASATFVRLLDPDGRLVGLAEIRGPALQPRVVFG